MSWLKMMGAALMVFGASLEATAASAKITKVLPHLLDQKGRHTLSPSLYERDAYQAHLRKNPDQRSALRFDIQWKLKEMVSNELTLRVELRGSKEAKPFVLEQPLRSRSGARRWTVLTLQGEDFKKMGELIAWRATLWDGERLLAEQTSFLW